MHAHTSSSCVDLMRVGPPLADHTHCRDSLIERMPAEPTWSLIICIFISWIFIAFFPKLRCGDDHIQACSWSRLHQTTYRIGTPYINICHLDWITMQTSNICWNTEYIYVYSKYSVSSWWSQATWWKYCITNLLFDLCVILITPRLLSFLLMLN